MRLETEYSLARASVNGEKYMLKKEDIIGQTNEPEEDYDLMELIIIRRGNEAADDEIFQYLESVFTSDIDRIKEYVDIPQGSGVEKEIGYMTGLGESLYNKAYKKAYDELYDEAYNKAYDKAYNEAYNEAYSEISIEMHKKTVILMLRKSYQRTGDVELIMQDLQEELQITYDEAKQIFENEINNHLS